MDPDTPSGSSSSAASLESELLAHRTWPALESEERHGWILRAARGFTRRANSALAIGEPEAGLAAAAMAVESWYAQRGVEPCVKITPLAPPALDRLLAEAGWTIATPATVMTGCVRPRNPSLAEVDDPRLDLAATPSTEWLERLFEWDRTPPATALGHEALLRRMRSSLFASWREGDRTVAQAVAAIEGGQAHLYDMIVAPDIRGTGVGGRFLPPLLERLGNSGCTRATLQVVAANTPALALYGGIGFGRLYDYHYRVAPRA